MLFYITFLSVSEFSLYFVDNEIEVNSQSFVFVEILDYPCHKFNLYDVFGSYFLWILIFIFVYEVIIKTL